MAFLKTQLCIDNTRWAYRPNLQGDPARDNFNSPRRQATIIVPADMVEELEDLGVRVNTMKNSDPDNPEYYVNITAKYHEDPSMSNPSIYLIGANGCKTLLSADMLSKADSADVRRIRVVVTTWRQNENTSTKLYIRSMYIECNPSDPFAADYEEAELPFA